MGFPIHSFIANYIAMSVDCPKKANRQLNWNASVDFDSIIKSLIKAGQ
jgi:hypothetical protein